nr:NTP transferase domain-containing protein [Mucilaginibacter straminoryzae]
MILINGNHFKAQKQIAIIHPAKSLEKKLEKLTDVQLILLADGVTEVPAFLNHLADVPVLKLEQQAEILQFLQTQLTAAIPPIHGLVLAGGKSIRMQTDKGSIAYHGQNQRIHTHHLLAEFCDEVSLSGAEEEGLPTIPDTFIGLGPFGGILSAMQKNPNAAWLTLACDLPYLTSATLQYLVGRRNPSKLATAFLDSDAQFPEPLITIWEPCAYPVMLQFLSQGYSCPRKVLINSDIELLHAPDVKEFRNVNRPEERDEALRFFKGEASA